MSLKPLQKEYNLVVSSKIENVEKVEAFTEKISKAMHFSEGERDSIAIAVTEALNNAILHGNKEDPSKSVEVWISSVKNGIKIVVKDEGEGFDLNAVPNPLEPENLLKESGRGIFILKSLMDHVEYKFTKGGTQVTMVKYKKDK
ncbi:MAG: ATP-binding protein [Calditrichaeota bacterium]|nr:MAG: ATP-binding protein [Calditrichota bacterium]